MVTKKPSRHSALPTESGLLTKSRCGQVGDRRPEAPGGVPENAGRIWCQGCPWQEVLDASSAHTSSSLRDWVGGWSKPWSYKEATERKYQV